MAGMYAVYHGPKGLEFIANNVHYSASTLANALEQLGYKQTNTSFFDTLQIKTDSKKIKAIAKEKKVNFFYPDKKTVTISLNETTSIRDINYIIFVFAEAANTETIEVLETPEVNNISESP